MRYAAALFLAFITLPSLPAQAFVGPHCGIAFDANTETCVGVGTTYLPAEHKMTNSRGIPTLSKSGGYPECAVRIVNNCDRTIKIVDVKTAHEPKDTRSSVLPLDGRIERNNERTDVTLAAHEDDCSHPPLNSPTSPKNNCGAVNLGTQDVFMFLMPQGTYFAVTGNYSSGSDFNIIGHMTDYDFMTKEQQEMSRKNSKY